MLNHLVLWNACSAFRVIKASATGVKFSIQQLDREKKGEK